MAQRSGLRKALAEKFDDELQVLQGLDRQAQGGRLDRPDQLDRGAAHGLGGRSAIPGLPVLEVGPGTGVITRAILARGVKPENLYSVEYSDDFVRHLTAQFPGVNIIKGDAFDLDATLGDRRGMVFDSVVSGVPLLNFPVAQRIRYIEDLLGRIPPGRPIMQLTYGPLSPVPPGRGDYKVEHFDFVLRNIPPTQLWVYRRPAA